jgi:membrane fusion protein (multidrug efflux system)
VLLEVVMSSKRIPVFFSIVLSTTILSSCSTEKKAPAASLPASQAVTVDAQIILPRELESKIFATGTVMATEEIDLRSEISGRITRINFTEGSSVSRGNLLLKINDADLQAKLARMTIERDLAEREERRQHQLLETKLASDREYDAAQAKLKTLNAEIDLIKADIAKTEIRSPIDGVVGLRWVSTGGYVTPSTPIARVQQLDRVKIDFSVPEKYASILKKDAKITFDITGSDRRYDGSVYAIEPKIDHATRTVKVRALAQNADRSLLPGAFAKVLLVLDKLDNALVVPTGSVVPELTGQKVFVYSNGKAQSRKVVTGIRTDSAIQIIEGVAPNDTLITSGLLQIKDKMPVKIRQF